MEVTLQKREIKMIGRAALDRDARRKRKKDPR